MCQQVTATNLQMLNDIRKVWQVNYQNSNLGGRGSGWGGGSSERFLKWGVGGSLKDLSKNIVKQMADEGKRCS